MPRMQDLAGQTFGLLTAVRRDEDKWWVCKCSCGGTQKARTGDLKSGTIKSCGCIRERHGMTGTGELTALRNAIRRCHNPKDDQYENYGGRGIKVCTKWRKSSAAFLMDMGPRPKGYQLDRYPDNDGDYKPSNCRWASPKENINNRRVTVYVNLRGKKTPASVAAEKLGVSYKECRKTLPLWTE